MRSKELKELRNACAALQGSIEGVIKNTKARGAKRIARKKVAVKNEDFEDEFGDEDLGDYEGDADEGDEADFDEGSIVDTAEAIVDMVESPPEEVEEEVKDQLLSDAADEVEDGADVDEVVENVRRRVQNIRRKVNNARRVRTMNARRLQNARRRRLFNAAAEEGLLNKAGSKYQNPISKFKNARKRYAWNDEAGDLNNGEGNGYREAKSGDSIGSIESTPDDGYPENRDGNFWPEKENTDDSINTYNARVRRIINKARAYDALMNGLGCGPNGCAGAGKVNLGDEREREAYNAGVLQNDRYVLHNGRVYAFNEGEDAFVPADTTAEADIPAAPEAEAGPYYDEEQNALVIPLSPAEEQALDADLDQASEGDGGAAAEGAGDGFDQMAGGGPLPGAGAATPYNNARRRGRVRNNRYRSVYNQRGVKKVSKKAETETKETQVNNSVQESGLDIPSTFPKTKE